LGLVNNKTKNGALTGGDSLIQLRKTFKNVSAESPCFKEALQPIDAVEVIKMAKITDVVQLQCMWFLKISRT
jgi:hypothetical protein